MTATPDPRLQSKLNDAEPAAAAEPKPLASVNWKDVGALGQNLRATVKRIEVDAKAKWFSAEFFDGRRYEFRRDHDNVTIKGPDGAAKMLAEGKR